MFHIFSYIILVVSSNWKRCGRNKIIWKLKILILERFSFYTVTFINREILFSVFRNTVHYETINILDIDGNGVWDQDEVKALFLKELDKLYTPGTMQHDLLKRTEEMERMREHVFNEADLNKDGLIKCVSVAFVCCRRLILSNDTILALKSS